MELIFNELSVRQQNSVAEGRALMSELIQVLRIATLKGMKRVLRSSVEVGDIPLAPGYSVVQWRNDRGVDRDETTFFRLMTARYPILSDLPVMSQRALGFEWKFRDATAIGFGVAALLDTIAVSLRTSDIWEHSTVSLDCTSLSDGGTICEERITVRHAVRSDHINDHDAWIFERVRDQVVDGEDLITCSAELLPNLVFCGESVTQIRALGCNHPLFHAVLKKLFLFEQYAAGWSTGAIDLDALPMKVTRESKPTLEAYPGSREFSCPDGTQRDFQWHARLTPGAWRIHFAWEETTRKILIGYIGPHLPTVGDPT
jgi:hypothetical protein